MRLTVKLTLGLVAGIFLVLLVHTLTRLQREAQLFERDIRRDHRTMGRALAAALDRVWERGGEADALELLRVANEREDHVDIGWVWLDGGPEEQRSPRIDPGLLGPLAELDQYSTVVADAEGQRHLFTYIRVNAPGGRPGAVELAENLFPERQYLRVTVIRLAVTLVAMVVLCGSLVLGMGYWLVGRPLRKLRDMAQRVGSGDLTERLDIEQRDEMGDLARQMNTMTVQLAEANTRVQAETAARIAALEQLRHVDRLGTVGRLASGIAHELGTPLNVVGARATMIAEQEVQGEEALHSARIISDQVDRMVRIIRQLLDFARARRGEVRVHGLCSIAEHTLELLRPLAAKQHVQLHVEERGAPVWSRVDAAQLQQVIMNLVVNAVQATPEGGTVLVTVGRRTARPPLEVGGAEGEFAAISVQDTGTGIAPEHLDHIFEPFFTTKEVGNGTGLGLAVAYGIVRDLKGWIDAESTPGKGSCFTVVLPLEEE